MEVPEKYQDVETSAVIDLDEIQNHNNPYDNVYSSKTNKLIRVSGMSNPSTGYSWDYQTDCEDKLLEVLKYYQTNAQS